MVNFLLDNEEIFVQPKPEDNGPTIVSQACSELVSSDLMDTNFPSRRINGKTSKRAAVAALYQKDERILKADKE